MDIARLACVLALAGCARATHPGNAGDGGTSSETDGAIDNDSGSGNGSGNGSGSGSGGGSNSDGGLVDAGVIDAISTSDAAVTNDASTGGAALLSQYSSRSCWSWGGFGTVRPDAPAHVLGFLEDPDGVADIATTGEVIILGDGAQFSLGQRALETLDETTCCRRATKVPITYDDFVAAAQVIDAGAMWGVRVIYRDLAGHTTVAVCDGAAGWRLNSTPIGS
jgi:hypothetical protein